jgi:transposase
MGARSAGNPHAACDVAGTGNVAWPRYCDTRKRKSETTGNTNFDLNRRASPRPYREVQVLKKAAAKSKKARSKTSGKPVAIVSYDEKPGIQAIATTAPDLPPVPGVHPAFARDFEYRRHGTLSLLAGIDLLTGKVHALVRDRHRSREFVEFLKLLDAAYPASTAIKLILDNHSAHISRETRAWLDTRPAGRFEFTFTPKHGSWLNLIEGFFSKFARSVLRHIRVTSKHELKERIMAGIDDVNKHPVIHTWSYKLAEAT